MALEQYHHLKHDSMKIQVDSAIRDGSGAKIDTTYLKKTESAPNAINATNAVNDGEGNKIDETYLKVSDLLNLVYPVGSIYTSVNSTNPHNLFGGDWEEFGQGKVLIGAGTGTDVNNVQRAFAVGESQTGEYLHTLTEAQMPAHGHSPSIKNTIDSSGNEKSLTGHIKGAITENSHPSADGVFSQDGNWNSGDKVGQGSGWQSKGVYMDATHSHQIEEYIKGSSQAHNNIQPYVVVYMWKRTA